MEYKPVALFKTSKAFNILGIRQVITGQIIRGEVSPGNYLKLTDGLSDVVFLIDAVEQVDYQQKEAEAGLIINPVDSKTEFDFDSILGDTIRCI